MKLIGNQDIRISRSTNPNFSVTFEKGVEVEVTDEVGEYLKKNHSDILEQDKPKKVKK